MCPPATSFRATAKMQQQQALTEKARLPAAEAAADMVSSPDLSSAPSLVSLSPGIFSLGSIPAEQQQPHSAVLLEALADPSLRGAASVLLKVMEETGTLTRRPVRTEGMETFDEAAFSAFSCRGQEQKKRQEEQRTAAAENNDKAAAPSLNELRIDAGVPPCPLPAAPLAHQSNGALPGGLGMMARIRRAPPHVVASRIPQARFSTAMSAYGTMVPTPQMGGGIPTESPRERLAAILKSRGYGATPTPSLEYFQPGDKTSRAGPPGAGNNKKQPSPSPLRLASYGTAVLRAVHTSNAASLKALLDAGLSPNPCNAFHDDVLHIVCKNGDYDLFEALLNAGASWHVCDSLGRTPLHHCCWSDDKTRARHPRGLGAVDIAAAVLERDPALLLLSDQRGRTPLDFVSSERWAEWNAFLAGNADRYWPRGEGASEAAGVVIEMLPHDPREALSPEEAVRVAAGKADPAPLAEERRRKMAMAHVHIRATHKRKLEEANYASAAAQHHQRSNAISPKARRRTVAGRCA